MAERFSQSCPSCESPLVVRQLACPGCGLQIEGEIALPTLARLSPEQREFVEILVVCGGSLKEVGQVLGVSYPTVRSRLDQVIVALQALRRVQGETRISVLERLERGEIDAKDAARQLRLLSH